MKISPEADTNPEADALTTPTIAGLVVKWCEKSKAGKKQAKAPWGSYFLSILSLTKAFFLRNYCAAKRSVGCNSGDVGLEGSDEIHEEILTSVTTNHQGQEVCLDHKFSDGHLKV
ncbi:Uncharacterized protein Rs2_16315 [Raphanus sativus]|nr:Uncharacterized protein Rs2_16315 [Raphanus sativus]